MGGIAAALFFVNRAFQETDPDRTIAAAGHDPPVVGEGEGENAALATRHDAGFGIADPGQRQDVNRVIRPGGGHAGARRIQRHGAQRLFAQTAAGLLAHTRLIAIQLDDVQRQRPVVANAQNLSPGHGQRMYCAAMNGLLHSRHLAFTAHAPNCQIAFGRSSQQRVVTAEGQRRHGGVQRGAEPHGQLGQLQEVNAGLGHAHGVAVTADGQQFAAGGDGVQAFDIRSVLFSHGRLLAG